MTDPYFKIKSLIRELKDAEAMLRLHTGKSNAVDKLMAEQFELKQQALVKELFAELIKSQISLSSIEPTLSSMLSYLKKHDKNQLISNDLQTSMAEVRAALA